MAIKLTWAALSAALTQASVIVMGDDDYVYVDKPAPPPEGAESFVIRYFNSDEIYCLVRQRDNEEVEACGSSVWVITHIGAEPLQLTLHRLWNLEKEVPQ